MACLDLWWWLVLFRLFMTGNNIVTILFKDYSIQNISNKSLILDSDFRLSNASFTSSWAFRFTLSIILKEVCFQLQTVKCFIMLCMLSIRKKYNAEYTFFYDFAPRLKLWLKSLINTTCVNGHDFIWRAHIWTYRCLYQLN